MLVHDLSLDQWQPCPRPRDRTAANQRAAEEQTVWLG